MSSDEKQAHPPLKRRDEIDEVFGRANPNPERVGCPPRDVLIALARRERPIDDPAYDHLSKCSPCYLEVRSFQQAAAVQRRRRLVTWMAAALVLITAGLAWLVTSRLGRGPQTTEVRTELDLRPYALMRSEPQPGDRKPLLLPRGRVVLTMLLPVGSESGPYDIQVLDSQLTSKASGKGEAQLRNQVTTLQTTLDLVSVVPGSYQLAIRRSGEDWQLFPAQLR
jgi:hypothetical protein